MSTQRCIDILFSHQESLTCLQRAVLLQSLSRCRISKIEVLVEQLIDNLLRVERDAALDVFSRVSIWLALRLVKPSLTDGAMTARILHTIPSLEVRPGGPYRLPNISSAACDLGWQVLIGALLATYGVSLPSIDGMIDDALGKSAFSSAWMEEAQILYYASFFYRGKKIEMLREYLTQRSITRVGMCSRLFTLIAFVRLGGDTEVLMSFLREELFITTCPLHGSASLCAALWLEAEYVDGQMMQFAAESKTMFSLQEQEMIDKIREKLAISVAPLGPRGAAVARGEVEKTLAANEDKQMSLISAYVRKALGSRGVCFSDDLIAELGLANVYFWTAFIVYDNFWDDDEKADPKTLPVANFFTRHFLAFFDAYFVKMDTEYRAFVRVLMDRVDAANSWEVICARAIVKDGVFFVPKDLPRYGDYEKKYDPTSAHILGPVALFLALGEPITSSAVSDLVEYFRCYLIPMQINDDLYDWKEDLQRGCLSTVVVMLLEDLGLPESFHLNHDKVELERVFWFKTLPRACDVALRYLACSRAALKRILLIEDYQPLETYIDRIEASIRLALHNQKASLDFLEEYKAHLAAL